MIPPPAVCSSSPATVMVIFIMNSPAISINRRNQSLQVGGRVSDILASAYPSSGSLPCSLLSSPVSGSNFRCGCEFVIRYLHLRACSKGQGLDIFSANLLAIKYNKSSSLNALLLARSPNALGLIHDPLIKFQRFLLATPFPHAEAL